jgi:hypothetical protein
MWVRKPVVYAASVKVSFDEMTWNAAEAARQPQIGVNRTDHQVKGMID